MEFWRWGVCDMGNSADRKFSRTGVYEMGELTRWEIHEMGSSRDREFTRYGVQDMGSLQDGEFRRWGVYKMGKEMGSSRYEELRRWELHEIGSSEKVKFGKVITTHVLYSNQLHDLLFRNEYGTLRLCRSKQL